MLLVDTNVLIDIVQDDPEWADWSIRQLGAQARLHELAINPVIYAELSLSHTTLEALDSAVATLELQLREVPRPALYLAGRAYLQYRQRGGQRAGVLPDFFIGAHAAAEGWVLLTRDAVRFSTTFPTLDIVAP